MLAQAGLLADGCPRTILGCPRGAFPSCVAQWLGAVEASQSQWRDRGRFSRPSLFTRVGHLGYVSRVDSSWKRRGSTQGGDEALDVLLQGVFSHQPDYTEEKDN